MRLSRVLAAATAAFFIAGCDSSPTTPEVNVDAALNQMASSSISGYSTAAMSMPAGAMMPSSTPGSSASSCPYNTTTRFFDCSPVTSNNVTFTRSYQLLDASGTALTTPNPLLVASIRSIIDIEGTIAATGPNPATTEIDRHEDATLSGLQSASRVLNGTATQRVSVTGSSFGFVANDTSTTTGLLLPTTQAQKYPLGGTIITSGTVSMSGATTSTQTHRREISFDGTSVMTVKITIGTSVTTCRINMETPGVAPVCS
ncbi:MAG TPA: hypothetical protein VFO55_10460 [Gemmatimonadaceae bacterium]|nr:hypothetical protein [Gemmatimonadaceae bacterium]